jgi:hypothetical protein
MHGMLHAACARLAPPTGPCSRMAGCGAAGAGRCRNGAEERECGPRLGSADDLPTRPPSRRHRSRAHFTQPPITRRDWPSVPCSVHTEPCTISRQRTTPLASRIRARQLSRAHRTVPATRLASTLRSIRRAVKAPTGHQHALHVPSVTRNTVALRPPSSPACRSPAARRLSGRAQAGPARAARTQASDHRDPAPPRWAPPGGGRGTRTHSHIHKARLTIAGFLFLSQTHAQGAALIATTRPVATRPGGMRAWCSGGGAPRRLAQRRRPRAGRG